MDSEEDGGRDGGQEGRCRRVDGAKRNDNSVGMQEEVKEQNILIISQHEMVHHGHSHAHSHLHFGPKNISSVAWMVIMGGSTSWRMGWL